MDKASKKTEYRIIRIKLIDGTLINGQVNINRDDGYDRLSDLLNSRKQSFLVLSNAASQSEGRDSTIKYPVLFINIHHVLWCCPDEDQK